jgi:hypothetical protein
MYFRSSHSWPGGTGRSQPVDVSPASDGYVELFAVRQHHAKRLMFERAKLDAQKVLD